MNDLATIIRQLKIYMISEESNPILEWFNDLWNKLSIVETNVYHKDGGEFIYYYIEDDKKQWIFFQDNKNDKFYCNYKHYWLILSSNFKLNSIGVQSITKFLVENALNNSVATPCFFNCLPKKSVENALNNSVATPYRIVIWESLEVENALNNSVATPVTLIPNCFISVENALNNTDSHTR